MAESKRIPVIAPFSRYPSLIETLPPLVRKQRREAAKIAKVAAAVLKEKATRADIDVLLVAAGLKKSDVAICLGYDVRHNEKAGQSSFNQEKLIAQLVAGGVDQAFVEKVLVDSTETGDPALYATVNPSKGAKVRTS